MVVLSILWQSCISSSINTPTPRARNCEYIIFFCFCPGALTSIKLIRPAGRSTMRSGIPFFPSFERRPPLRAFAQLYFAHNYILLNFSHNSTFVNTSHAILSHIILLLIILHLWVLSRCHPFQNMRWQQFNVWKHLQIKEFLFYVTSVLFVTE